MLLKLQEFKKIRKIPHTPVATNFYFFQFFLCYVTLKNASLNCCQNFKTSCSRLDENYTFSSNKIAIIKKRPYLTGCTEKKKKTNTSLARNIKSRPIWCIPFEFSQPKFFLVFSLCGISQQFCQHHVGTVQMVYYSI